MEDFIWVVFAVIAAVFSLANKVAKQRRERYGNGPSQAPPQWPGPVAGPKPGQGPTWAPAPRPQGQGSGWAPAPAGSRPGFGQAPKPPEEPKKEAPKTLVGDIFTRPLDSEGLGSEGIGSEGVGAEGPGVGEGVEEEISRFTRDSEFMEKRGLAQLSDDLGRPDQGAYSLAPEAVRATDLQSTLTDSFGLSRAVVLSEVLGKPKALRGRGARRF